MGSAAEAAEGRVVEHSERPIAHMKSENVDEGWDVTGVVEGANILANTLVLLLLLVLVLVLVAVPVVLNDIVDGACCNTPTGFSDISAPRKWILIINPSSSNSQKIRVIK